MNNSDSSLSSNEEEEMIQIFLDNYEVLSIEMNEVIKLNFYILLINLFRICVQSA